MVTINIDQVAKKAEERKKAPAPKISFTIVKSGDKVKVSSTDRLSMSPTSMSETSPQPKKGRSETKSDLQSEAWKAFDDIHLHRAKVSNTIWDAVESGAQQSELKHIYAKVESFRPALQEAFDIARHVDQYGQLPEVKKADEPVVDILVLKDQKRKLVDRRCKLQTKIKKGEAKNPGKVIEWKVELDQANADYSHVDEQLKKLEGKVV